MHILDSLFLVPGQRLDILWLNKESLGLRNKNLIWICHSAVVKDLHSFPLREGSVAQLFLPTNGAQAGSPALTCKKMDMVRIMKTREEKPVITFATWEVLCYLECGCLRGTQTWHSQWWDFSALSQSKHDIALLQFFQDWQRLAVIVRRQFIGGIFHLWKKSAELMTPQGTTSNSSQPKRILPTQKFTFF